MIRFSESALAVWFLSFVAVVTSAELLPETTTAIATKVSKPLWEFGLGLGVLHQTYYTGTSQKRTFVAPLPTVIYRGNMFRSDNDGLRAQLIDNDRVELAMSFGLNLGVDSDDVDLREGMDDTDTLFEIGPSLKIMLNRTATSQWRLSLPLRVNVGISSEGVDESGFTFAPEIQFSRRFGWADREWVGSASAGVGFGTRDFQNNYYGVPSRFATQTRPAYEAASGFSDTRLTLSLRHKNDGHLFGVYTSIKSVKGASFEDSPLVETTTGFTVGAIYSWFFLQSDRLAPD